VISGFHTLSMESIDYREAIHEYEGWLAYNGVWEGSITIPMVLLCLF
jgi:hypothetical protein